MVMGNWLCARRDKGEGRRSAVSAVVEGREERSTYLYIARRSATRLRASRARVDALSAVQQEIRFDARDVTTLASGRSQDALGAGPERYISSLWCCCLGSPNFVSSALSLCHCEHYSTSRRQANSSQLTSLNFYLKQHVWPWKGWQGVYMSCGMRGCLGLGADEDLVYRVSERVVPSVIARFFVITSRVSLVVLGTPAVVASGRSTDRRLRRSR